jgi:uncharacterized membrane protein YqjE
MHTQETEHEGHGLGFAAKQLAERASALVRLELELAAVELKGKATLLAKGIALALVGAVLLFYALGFLLAGAAAGIATATSVWAALLIVTGGLVLIAAVLGALAYQAIKKATPPMPEQAVREAKLTTEVLKHDGHV